MKKLSDLSRKVNLYAFRNAAMIVATAKRVPHANLMVKSRFVIKV